MARLGPTIALAVLLLLAPALAACGQGRATPTASAGVGVATPVASPGGLGTPGSPTVPRITGKLTIFAAASLTDAFGELKTALERANPGTTIAYNFGASSTLRTQLAQGAKADLFASADEPQMNGAQRDGTIAGTPSTFVENKLVIIVPARDPRGIASPRDLAKPGVKLVLTNAAVPIGNYARQALKKLNGAPDYGADFSQRVLANLVSEETDVRQVVAKVQLGEGDAGIVYSSDVTPAVRDQVKVIPIPDQFNVIARYPIAVVKGTGNDAGARAFIGYLLSPAGQAVLARWGFIPVGPTSRGAPTARGEPRARSGG